MDKTLYWLWLSLGLGTANPVAGQLVKRQLDPSELFEMDVRGLLHSSAAFSNRRRLIAPKRYWIIAARRAII